MKYNKSYKGGNFNDYFEYLETIKSKISKDLYDFVSDVQRHDLSEKSLHDSRIKKIEYEFISKDTYQVSLLLTGENRTFELRFNKVSQFNMKQQNLGDLYKDLITYEVGIEEDTFGNDKIVFRAEFPFEAGVFEVYSENLEITENILQQG